MTKNNLKHKAIKKTEIIRIIEIHESSHRKNTKGVNHALLKHLLSFDSKIQYINDISEETCIKFATYLQSAVRQSSAITYLNKLHAILEHALLVKAIELNPMPPVKTLIHRDPQQPRTYLTKDEILALKSTTCPNEQTRLAFLFACHVGLRLSDIETLRWGGIHEVGNCLKIIKTQIKTGTIVEIPINTEARRILEQLDSKDRGFNLKSRSAIANDLKKWAEAADINKHLTFHVSRHTFATQTVAAGVGIYTVSKLCGHSSVKTTQIYAHMMDNTLQEGVDMLAKSLNGEQKTEKEPSTPSIIVMLLQPKDTKYTKIPSGDNTFILNQIKRILSQCKQK